MPDPALGQSLEPQQHSLAAASELADTLVAIAFPYSRAKTFALTLRLAQEAAEYRTTETDGKTYHLAVFSRDPGQPALAQMVLRNLHDKAGVLAWSAGQPVEPWQMQKLLNCMTQADQTNNWQAHCHRVVDDRNLFEDFRPHQRPIPGVPGWTARDEQAAPTERWLVPCRFVINQGGRLNTRHPARPAEQFQAAAVRTGCHVCQRFNAEKLVKLAV